MHHRSGKRNFQGVRWRRGLTRGAALPPRRCPGWVLVISGAGGPKRGEPRRRRCAQRRDANQSALCRPPLGDSHRGLASVLTHCLVAKWPSSAPSAPHAAAHPFTHHACPHHNSSTSGDSHVCAGGTPCALLHALRESRRAPVPVRSPCAPAAACGRRAASSVQAPDGMTPSHPI